MNNKNDTRFLKTSRYPMPYVELYILTYHKYLFSIQCPSGGNELVDTRCIVPDGLASGVERNYNMMVNIP